MISPFGFNILIISDNDVRKKDPPTTTESINAINIRTYIMLMLRIIYLKKLHNNLTYIYI